MADFEELRVRTRRGRRGTRCRPAVLVVGRGGGACVCVWGSFTHRPLPPAFPHGEPPPRTSVRVGGRGGGELPAPLAEAAARNGRPETGGAPRPPAPSPRRGRGAGLERGSLRKTFPVTALGRDGGLGEPVFHPRRVACAGGGVRSPPSPVPDILKAVLVACGPTWREAGPRPAAGGSHGGAPRPREHHYCPLRGECPVTTPFLRILIIIESSDNSLTVFSPGKLCL